MPRAKLAKSHKEIHGMHVAARDECQPGMLITSGPSSIPAPAVKVSELYFNEENKQRAALQQRRSCSQFNGD